MNVITMPRNAITRGIKLSTMLVTLCISAVIHSVADAQEGPPIFGDVTINKPFSSDPLTVRGMSGGSIPASQLVGKNETPTGSCSGFMDKVPDHTLELTSNFDYLKLQVQSPADTTIIIKGPGGIWCNDDLDGKNPGIVGEWLQGTYQVWVGSYTKGKYLPYSLTITQFK